MTINFSYAKGLITFQMSLCTFTGRGILTVTCHPNSILTCVIATSNSCGKMKRYMLSLFLFIRKHYSLVSLLFSYLIIVYVPQNTENLRWVDLSHSKSLLNLSGLSKAKNLERLDLEGCTSLAVLDSSIKQMNKLIYLNLRDCTSLESLPDGINLKSLKTLILSGCSNLQEFHIISENIESLYLEGSAIEQVVEHIQSLGSLILLNLKNCKRLRYLPNDLYKLKSLQELILSGCSGLESLPPIKEKMDCLEILLMDGTSLKQTPETNFFSNLKKFSFCGSTIEDSTGLVFLPFSGSSSVSDLYLTNCNINKLPDSFSSLHSLRCLC